MGDMHLLEVIVYLDDIIVFGSTLEEHERRLLKVLDRLEEYGLKISLTNASSVCHKSNMWAILSLLMVLLLTQRK